jgi:hypothetical protein
LLAHHAGADESYAALLSDGFVVAAQTLGARASYNLRHHRLSALFHNLLVGGRKA